MSVGFVNTYTDILRESIRSSPEFSEFDERLQALVLQYPYNYSQIRLNGRVEALTGLSNEAQVHLLSSRTYAESFSRTDQVLEDGFQQLKACHCDRRWREDAIDDSDSESDDFQSEPPPVQCRDNDGGYGEPVI